MKAPRLIPITLSLAVLAALAFAAARGLAQQAGDVVTYRPAPQKKGRPVDIPRGETLFALFLQQLADSTGESVCLKTEEPADLRITVDRSLAQLDETTA